MRRTSLRIGGAAGGLDCCTPPAPCAPAALCGRPPAAQPGLEGVPTDVSLRGARAPRGASAPRACPTPEEQVRALLGGVPEEQVRAHVRVLALLRGRGGGGQTPGAGARPPLPLPLPPPLPPGRQARHQRAELPALQVVLHGTPREYIKWTVPEAGGGPS